MINPVTNRKAHDPVTCPVAWEGFLPDRVGLGLDGSEGFGKQRFEEGLPQKWEVGSKVG